MPPLLAALPVIISAVGAGVGATELGLQLSGAGQPGKPSPYPTAQDTAQKRNALAQAVNAGRGNFQETGLTGNDQFANFIAQNTGTLNDMSALQDLTKQYGGGGFGGGGGPTTNFPNLSIPSQSNQTLSGGTGLTDSSVFGGG